jgi:hypothetical protein
MYHTRGIESESIHDLFVTSVAHCRARIMCVVVFFCSLLANIENDAMVCMMCTSSRNNGFGMLVGTTLFEFSFSLGERYKKIVEIVRFHAKNQKLIWHRIILGRPAP